MKKLLFVVLLAASSVSAQITITSSDIPQNIGDRFVTTADSTPEVNVGHQGGPQHWEFQLLNPIIVDTTYVVPVGDSPILDSFPSTNLLYRTVWPDTSVRIEFYGHCNLSGSSLLGLGWAEVLDTPFTMTMAVYHPPSSELQFPTTYNSAWTSDFSYTVVMDTATNSYMVTTANREHLVDAWGTVTTPLGSFNTLRAKNTSTAITDTYIMGALIWSDTSNKVSFNWLVNGHGPIVCVIADSVFQDSLTTPTCYSLVTDATVFVEEGERVSVDRPLNVRLLGNPTSLPLRLELEIGQSEQATIEIYDVSGRLIDRFGHVKPGFFTWNGIAHNGRRIPAGTYIVKVKTTSGTRSLAVSIM